MVFTSISTVEKITVLESQNIRFRKSFLKMRCRDRRFYHFEFEFFWQLKMVEMSNGWNLVMEESKWYVEIFEKRATCGRQMSQIMKKHEFLNFCMTLLLLRFLNRLSPDLTDQNPDNLTVLVLKIIMTYQFLYLNRLVQRLDFPSLNNVKDVKLFRRRSNLVVDPVTHSVRQAIRILTSTKPPFIGFEYKLTLPRVNYTLKTYSISCFENFLILQTVN